MHTTTMLHGVHTGMEKSKWFVVPGRSSDTTSAKSTNADTKQITVSLPECLLGTQLGEQLVSRILHDSWEFEDGTGIDQSWFTQTPPDTMRDVQRRLRKETVKGSRKCETCGKTTSIKCQGCKEVYYCDEECQKANWKKHKKKCTMPPLSIQEHVLIAVPDYECFWQYQKALIAVNSPEHLGISVMSRERFKEMFGDDATLVTIMSLAATGKPWPHVIRAFGQVGSTSVNHSP